MPTPQYNETQLNTEQYNESVLSLNLDDSQGSTDAITMFVFLSLEDTQALADALTKSIEKGAFTESVSGSDADTLKDSINAALFNQTQYNSLDTSFGVASQAGLVKQETITSSDQITAFDAVKSLADSLASNDTIIQNTTKKLNDSVFINEVFAKEISNKALNDVIKVADWFIIERKPTVRPW